MSLESDGGMIYWQGKTEELGEKPVPVPLCLIYIYIYIYLTASHVPVTPHWLPSNVRNIGSCCSIAAVTFMMLAVSPELGHECRYSIHPTALKPISGLVLHYLLPPQCYLISGKLPVATAQKASSILLHRIFPSSPGLSNRSHSFKLSFKHFF
jgi:hypothetical protein